MGDKRHVACLDLDGLRSHTLGHEALGCATGQMLSHPSAMVLIPRTTKPIRFQPSVAFVNCEQRTAAPPVTVDPWTFVCRPNFISIRASWEGASDAACQAADRDSVRELPF
jgi:hypothetical protein